MTCSEDDAAQVKLADILVEEVNDEEKKGSHVEIEEMTSEDERELESNIRELMHSDTYGYSKKDFKTGPLSRWTHPFEEEDSDLDEETAESLHAHPDDHCSKDFLVPSISDELLLPKDEDKDEDEKSAKKKEPVKKEEPAEKDEAVKEYAFYAPAFNESLRWKKTAETRLASCIDALHTLPLEDSPNVPSLRVWGGLLEGMLEAFEIGIPLRDARRLVIFYRHMIPHIIEGWKNAAAKLQALGECPFTKADIATLLHLKDILLYSR